MRRCQLHLRQPPCHFKSCRSLCRESTSTPLACTRCSHEEFNSWSSAPSDSSNCSCRNSSMGCLAAAWRALGLAVAASALALLTMQPLAAASQDVKIKTEQGIYNPSLVYYQGEAVFVARSTQLKWDTTGLKWIVNKAHLCTSDTKTFNQTR